MTYRTYEAVEKAAMTGTQAAFLALLRMFQNVAWPRSYGLGTLHNGALPRVL
jgi:hypothetical protein